MNRKSASVVAYNKNCVGCKRNKKDIMLSFMIKNTKSKRAYDFHDWFLTTEQAESLIDRPQAR